MFIKSNYLINQNFMYMLGQHDRNGKLCTFVMEINKVFLVDKSPIEILKYSIEQIGFDLRGAIASSKSFLGDVHMCPIMVNPLKGICLFSTKSAKHYETIWVNPVYVAWTNNFNRKTAVTFKNGHRLIIPIRLSSFNSKLQNAVQLKKFTVGVAQNPVYYVIYPNERRARSVQRKKRR